MTQEEQEKANRQVFLARHPEFNLYKRLSENLPKWVRTITKLDKANKAGKFNLPLNDKGLPF